MTEISHYALWSWAAGKRETTLEDLRSLRMIQRR